MQPVTTLRALVLVGLWLVTVSPRAAHSQAKEPEKSGPVKVAMHILTELNIAELAIDVKPFTDWARPLIESIEDQFKDEKARRDIVVQVTLHPRGPLDVAAAGRPALSKEEAKALVDLVRRGKAPQSKIIDFSFRLTVDINGGHPAKDLALSPPIETPDERRFGEFGRATTAERLAMLQRWASTEALPVLAATFARVDKKFAGVRAVGKMIDGLDLARPIDVDKLTDHNPDYWRAFVEMSPGQPDIPMVRIALLVNSGEIDKARRLADVVSPFDANKSGSSRLLGECRAFLRIFFERLEKQIGDGIKLHDQGKLGDALAVYDGVIKDYPKSAWANYERYHTLFTMDLEGKKKDDQAPKADWQKSVAIIRACDPLYATGGQLHTGIEAYHTVRRMELNELFKKPDDRGKDLIKYADIALDVGAYGFAATIYWNAILAIDPKEYGDRTREDLVEYFLYALEQLKVSSIKENFRGDHKAAFARIKAERQKLMEESAIFKTLEKRGDEAGGGNGKIEKRK